MIDELDQTLTRAAAAIRPPAPDPGAFAAGAREAGIEDVAYATDDSPIGRLLIAATQRGLVRISYLDHFPEDAVLEDLAARVSPRVLEDRSALDEPRHQLDEYFAGRRRSFELPLDWALVGEFGRRVLGRTAAIPYGEVETYGDVAREIGHPGAARATGNALGANPIPIVVPCHRVVRAGGVIGHYTGGRERKLQLLALEAPQGRLGD